MSLMSWILDVLSKDWFLFPHMEGYWNQHTLDTLGKLKTKKKGWEACYAQHSSARL